jgi:3'(2'), 5'-bisphosphate nucleotidase
MAKWSFFYTCTDKQFGRYRVSTDAEGEFDIVLNELVEQLLQRRGGKMVYEREQQVAIAAVTAAAQLCQRVRGEHALLALSKPDRSPVTVADFGAQAIICRVLTEVFPSDAIVAEETAVLLGEPEMVQVLHQVTDQVQEVISEATPTAVMSWIHRGTGTVGQRFWALDPIDGTKGFLRGDHYAIALALIEAGEVKLGVLACPALVVAELSAEPGVLFTAVRGHGTWLRMLSGAAGVHRARPVMRQPRLAESVEAGHGNRLWQRQVAQAVGLTETPLQMDSQAKYGAIACGQAALYLRLPWTEKPDYQEYIWDHAAGAIVVEEAGGCVTDMDGKPLDFTQGTTLVANRGIVASASDCHEAVLAVLAKGEAIAIHQPLTDRPRDSCPDA